MPIRWSALRVSEAMDEVERQIDAAQPFFDVAKDKAREAKTIPNLPGHMNDRLSRLIWDIDRIQAVRAAIASVRRDIPSEALNAERNMPGQPALIEEQGNDDGGTMPWKGDG